VTPKKSSMGFVVMTFCSGVRVGAAAKWTGSEAGGRVKGICMPVMVCASRSISTEDLEVLRQFPKTLENREEVDIFSERIFKLQVKGFVGLSEGGAGLICMR
jgi:hypothetical protein